MLNNEINSKNYIDLVILNDSDKSEIIFEFKYEPDKERELIRTSTKGYKVSWTRVEHDIDIINSHINDYPSIKVGYVILIDEDGHLHRNRKNKRSANCWNIETLEFNESQVHWFEYKS